MKRVQTGLAVAIASLSFVTTADAWPGRHLVRSVGHIAAAPVRAVKNAVHDPSPMNIVKAAVPAIGITACTANTVKELPAVKAVTGLPGKASRTLDAAEAATKRANGMMSQVEPTIGKAQAVLDQVPGEIDTGLRKLDGIREEAHGASTAAQQFFHTSIFVVVGLGACAAYRLLRSPRRA